MPQLFWSKHESASQTTNGIDNRETGVFDRLIDHWLTPARVHHPFPLRRMGVIP